MSFSTVAEALRAASERAQQPPTSEPKPFSRAKHLDRILEKRAITPVFQPLPKVVTRIPAFLSAVTMSRRKYPVSSAMRMTTRLSASR